MGKTGSSALQTAFVRNRLRLADLSVHYPPIESDPSAERGEAVSGNGVEVYPFLCPEPRFSNEDIDRSIQRVFEQMEATKCQSVLYSSEFRYYFSSERLTELRQRLDDSGYGLRVVLFVRDIAGLVVSSYAQNVKADGYVSPMTTFVHAYAAYPDDMGVQPRLAVLLDILGPENIVVIRYDAVRGRILEAFMERAFSRTDLLDFDLVLESVNRSLTPQQTEWMRYMNAGLHGTQPAEIATGVLLRHAPERTDPPVVTREELGWLDRRFGAEVAWVNEHFGDLGLSVAGGATVVDARDDSLDPTATERHLLDCIIDLANAQAGTIDALTAAHADAAALTHSLNLVTGSRRWRISSAFTAPLAGLRRRRLRPAG
jgi:hypothetical protein